MTELNPAGGCDGYRPRRSAAADHDPTTALADGETANVTVDGDTNLAQHWLDNTAHVSD